MKNYRPISLLNCVYKIASGCIANRIKTTLNKLIHSDQIGFIAGRYIGENTRLLYDIMHTTEEKNLSGLLLLIDFEKAFDSISWKFINNVLKYFGFGESIISWVNLFYKNAMLSVNQGGNLSSVFHIGRGCRQGDPLSPYIFILCSEILAIKIRNNKNIKGITIGNNEYKLSQYADDTSAILDGSDKSLNETLSELSFFSKYSGLKVNFDKTQVVWIGRKKYSSDTIKTRWKLNWGRSQFKLLGITFNIDLDEIVKINYEEKIIKIKNLIKRWQCRYITPLGKITVIKSLLLPILNHLFISIPNPSEQIIKELNTLFYDFIWKGPAKIKRTVLTNQYINGGLDMVNIEVFISSLKLTWIRRLISKEGNWKSIIENNLNIIDFVNLGSNFIKNENEKINNKFWKDVIKSMYDFQKINKPKKIDHFLTLPIFQNEDILIGNKPFFLKTWYNKGVRYINDFINENGKFYSEHEFTTLYSINSNFIQYNGILRAIKTFLKNHDITEFYNKSSNPLIPFSILNIVEHKNGCKGIYNILNKNIHQPTSKSKWEQEYQVEDECWKEIYVAPFEKQYSSILRWFQVRVNHRILPTNKFLYKIHIKDSPLCHYCQQEETLTHMLWTCTATKELLQEIKEWFNINNIYISFIEQPFIFNIGNNYSDVDLLIILEIKYYIFSAKRLLSNLSIVAFKNRITNSYLSLKYIATKNNQIEKFTKDWNKYKNIFNS